MNIYKRSRIVSRLASLGLALVLVAMSGFAVWSARMTKILVNQARLASQLNDQYQIAHYAVGQEESLERKYRLEPGQEVFQKHRDMAATLASALQAVQQIGDAQERQFIAPLLEKHQQYLAATARMFAAVDAGDTRRVIALDTGDVDPIFGFIEEQVDDRAIQEHETAITRLARLEHTQSLIQRATPLVACIGVGLLVIFWYIQSTFQQRTEETTRETLRASEERFRSLVRNTSDVIAILTPEAIMRYVSPAAERIWAYPVATLQGHNLTEYIHPEDIVDSQAFLNHTHRESNTNSSTRWRMRHADGSWRYVDVIANYLPAEPGIEGMLVTFRDITDRKTIEDALTHQASHDTLSGLPNRSFFMDRLSRVFTKAKQYKEGLAVVFLDLDNFKVINDSLGHEAGDMLLIAVTERLQTCVRPGDIVARLGGDEFTMLLENIRDHADIVAVAERVAGALKEPILLAGREVFVTTSIGIARFHSSHTHAEDILRDADVAMYQAKTGGKAGFVVFDPSMNTQAMERLELEMDLRRAVDRGEFKLYYQPIVMLATNHITEVEALVRWQHPQKGLVSPLAFIPIAEETGLILPLGEWILAEACRHCVAWHQQYPHETPLVMSVNLSTRQLQQPDLVETIACILKETGMPAGSLKLEITESVMMLDTNSTIAKLHQLKDMGIRLAVDDFGTGYSSMTYLSSLPIDTLKIDRSFVQKLGQQTEDDAIVRAILTMAKSMNLGVTAEGVETEAQMNQLNHWGCDRIQGFYLARPLPAAELDAMLAKEAAHEKFSAFPAEDDQSEGLSDRLAA